MLRVAVLVSGGETNLQAIIDAVKDGTITNTELVAVISNNANAYALTRAKEHGIEALCISPKDYADRADFHKALLEKINPCFAKLFNIWSKNPIPVSISDSPLPSKSIDSWISVSLVVRSMCAARRGIFTSSAVSAAFSLRPL